ncbi:hypothetical protein U9M73_11710 [Paenibacillus phoenicis]|uniref:Uncharacterized protein n=2 Tax=Paenibacillus TaxID=44249 RepID=A0ABW3S946_9BACL|nr:MULTISPECIES: hypothetical protein [Paenibacillus]MCH1638810.1 hypothetical protein [Paenibacillus timonensis]MDU2239920.1 hypothetical protein [Paenibacillus sp.]MEA3570665.1 hypothetical protein [Paenibacillus phoenicis]
MMNHYVMEQLMKFQQKEIEERARQAWKWLDTNSLKGSKNNSTSVVLQPIAACCAACC